MGHFVSKRRRLPKLAATPTNTRMLKVAMLCQDGVGKTSLTLRFVPYVVGDMIEPVVDDGYIKKITPWHGEGPIVFDILDSSGASEFSGMEMQWIISNDAFCIVYDITNKSSFQKIQGMKEKICYLKEVVSPKMILVGNKRDLTEKREVSVEEGKALAKFWGCSFLETSARLNDNIFEVFLDLAIQWNIPDMKKFAHMVKSVKNILEDRFMKTVAEEIIPFVFLGILPRENRSSF